MYKITGAVLGGFRNPLEFGNFNTRGVTSAHALGRSATAVKVLTGENFTLTRDLQSLSSLTCDLSISCRTFDLHLFLYFPTERLHVTSQVRRSTETCGICTARCWGNCVFHFPVIVECLTVAILDLTYRGSPVGNSITIVVWL